VSSTRFLGILCFAVSLFSSSVCAQYGVDEIRVTGEVRPHDDDPSNHLFVEAYNSSTRSLVEREQVIHGQFELNRLAAGSYTVRLVTAPNEDPLVEVYYQLEPGSGPLVLDLPERTTSKPISGVVSLHDLQHPVPKKALREAYEAQQLARDNNNLPKAIAKLEHAIGIYPAFRNAHLNLGVLYARAGRTADARAQFQKALDIGPPEAPIYADLALISLMSGQRQEAGTFARKALELDPANVTAQQTLQYVERPQTSDGGTGLSR
jgi:tetratricopeptide (TPR) repeat protein